MVLEAGKEEEIAAINKLFPPLSMESTRLQQHVCRVYIQGRRLSRYTILVFCVLSLSFYIFYFHAACVWFVSVSCESPECEAHSTFREHAECKCGVKPATATVPCPPAEREREHSSNSFTRPRLWSLSLSAHKIKRWNRIFANFNPQYTPAIQGHRVQGVKNLWFQKSHTFPLFQA